METYSFCIIAARSIKCINVNLNLKMKISRRPWRVLDASLVSIMTCYIITLFKFKSYLIKDKLQPWPHICWYEGYGREKQIAGFEIEFVALSFSVYIMCYWIQLILDKYILTLALLYVNVYDVQNALVPRRWVYHYMHLYSFLWI